MSPAIPHRRTLPFPPLYAGAVNLTARRFYAQFNGRNADAPVESLGEIESAIAVFLTIRTLRFPKFTARLLDRFTDGHVPRAMAEAMLAFVRGELAAKAAKAARQRPDVRAVDALLYIAQRRLASHKAGVRAACWHLSRLRALRAEFLTS